MKSPSKLLKRTFRRLTRSQSSASTATTSSIAILQGQSTDDSSSFSSSSAWFFEDSAVNLPESVDSSFESIRSQVSSRSDNTVRPASSTTSAPPSIAETVIQDGAERSYPRLIQMPSVQSFSATVPTSPAEIPFKREARSKLTHSPSIDKLSIRYLKSKLPASFSTSSLIRVPSASSQDTIKATKSCCCLSELPSLDSPGYLRSKLASKLLVFIMAASSTDPLPSKPDLEKRLCADINKFFSQKLSSKKDLDAIVRGLKPLVQERPAGGDSNAFTGLRHLQLGFGRSSAEQPQVRKEVWLLGGWRTSRQLALMERIITANYLAIRSPNCQVHKPRDYIPDSTRMMSPYEVTNVQYILAREKMRYEQNAMGRRIRGFLHGNLVLEFPPVLTHTRQSVFGADPPYQLSGADFLAREEDVSIELQADHQWLSGRKRPWNERAVLMSEFLEKRIGEDDMREEFAVRKILLKERFEKDGILACRTWAWGGW